MHNFKNRVGYICLLLAVVLIGVKPNQVEADALKNYNSNYNDSTANKNCANELDIVFSARQDSNNGYIDIKATNGRWTLYIYYADFDLFDYSDVFGSRVINPTNKVIYNANSNVQTISIPKTNDVQRVIIKATLEGNHAKDRNGNDLQVKDSKGNMVTCKNSEGFSINNSGAVSIKGSGAFYATAVPAKVTTSYKTIDDSAQKECSYMKTGKYNSDGSESTYDITDSNQMADYNNKMQKIIPVCYDGFSRYSYTADKIKKLRQSSLRYYKTYKELQATQVNNTKYDQASQEIASGNYKMISYNTKTKKTVIGNTLKCNKATSTDTTEKYYTRTTEVDNNACKVDCQEQIQITYGPPVATKAGLCFQYKVTVRSKVTCTTTIKKELEWPSVEEKDCDVSPICSGNSKETQAGPKEEFDSCISKCDNGEYSQSCINKCYKEVYSKKKSTSKKTTSSNKVKATKLDLSTNNAQVTLLANTTKDPYKSNNKCNSNDNIKNNINECAAYFSNIKSQTPAGYYYQKDGKIQWQPCFGSGKNYESGIDSNKCFGIIVAHAGSDMESTRGPSDWIESVKRSSPYYFRNTEVALKTLNSFQAVASGTNGYGERRYYIIDDGGIKRQRTSRYKCNETCWYVSQSGDYNACNSSSSSQVDDIIKQFDNLEDKMKNCTAKAVCKEGKAEFEISVDHSKKNDTKKDTTKWNATNTSGISGSIDYEGKGDTNMFVPILDGESIPKDLEDKIPNGINGTCYGRDNKSYWQHYKTTITFPGVWINRKNGETLNRKPNNEEKSYLTEKKNYYCVGYDYKPVNEKWFDWKISKVGDINKIIVEKDDNIKASIKSFGKYNWEVNVNCFYALKNTLPSTSKCSGAECDTQITNVKMRPIDQANIFAGRTGDEVGFNWTSAAKDYTAGSKSGYDIDPGKYAQKLQEQAKSNANSIYSGTSDYSLHLTKENIKELRKYVQKNGYTKYEGKNNNKVEDVNGLYYYKSNILDKDEYTTNFKRTTQLGVNKGGVS